MALSNRDRIGRMFDVVAPELEAFLHRTVGTTDGGKSWLDVYEAVDRGGHDVNPGDPSIHLKFLAQDYTNRYKRGWRPLRGVLNRTHEDWAHLQSFGDDDAYRALDTAERLMRAIAAPDAADEIARTRLNLRRVTADKADKKSLQEAVVKADSTGLRPWREVLRPHDDVATGNFHASEFAADLFKVATGTEVDDDYADPTEFFRRTYLTEGLQDLIGRAVRRLSGDANAAPVINLQTNFGGGKTHSMLALWHVAAGLELGKFPQATQELLQRNGYAATAAKRVALVGNHISPAGDRKPDGTQVNTLWGELAWQLGGAEAYALVARADQDRTPPGRALHDLLATHAPAVILVDEWVAYARSLVGRDDLAGGTFDDQFTFAQQLTEVAKGTPGVLLAISIPASETGKSGAEETEQIGNAEEVGGAHGIEALKRLQNVVRRVADQWRPASSAEAYDIVKQRLFTEPQAAELAAISQTARAFVEMYRKFPSDFPATSREGAYEDRIKRSYPIHPELFDTLYEEWSSLERFQRTRGVLRLMSTVIHALWMGEDSSPLIMPASIPLAHQKVNPELVQYLPDQWKGVIDADVDGDNSQPTQIDQERPTFGQRALTKRLARTVFFGAAPTIGSSHKGIETQRVFLGTAVPGDVPGNFHSALNVLSDRATYFYSGQGKYWYDLQANITRTAKDQAARLHPEDVWKEIVRRLDGQARTRGDFAGVHVCPEDTADIPDNDEARLVILHPKVAHRRRTTDTEAVAFARAATEHKGGANRVHRNMLVFLAADEDRLSELDAAVRDYLGWSHVLEHEAELDLSVNQKNQATLRREQADQTIGSRLLQTFIWALVPEQPDPTSPYGIRETKVEGQSAALAERVSRKLGNDGVLSPRLAAATVKLAIQKVPQIWGSGHVSVGDLWALMGTYAYMPRLRDRRVLDEAVLDMPMIWQTDAFALATAYDDAAGRYVGLWAPSSATAAPPVTDSLLLVRADVAARQLESEEAAPSTADPDEPRDDPRQHFEEDPDHPGVHHQKFKKRFFGVKDLTPERYAVDFRNIADEVIAHLVASGADVRVRIEIEADHATGFEDAKVRTVSENATTLKFEQAGFEES
jgi:predicted AAA+ superfamily ATPase